MKKYGFPLLLAGIVVVMIAIFAIGNKNAPVTQEPQRLGTKHQSDGDQHVADGTKIEYKTNLPSSGNHYGATLPTGLKDTEIADERMVHNLEHGDVWIAYKPDLPAAEVQKLKDLFNNLPPSPRFKKLKAVLAPRSKNSHPIQLAAWTYTLNLDSFDEAKIRQFYTDHVEKGPELVP